MKKIKTLIPVLIPVLIPALLFFSCTAPQEAAKPANTEVIPVKVMALTAGNGGKAIPVSGQFTTDDEVYLSFKNGGIINKILVKEGDKISKGQLLATLNLTEINTHVTQARIAYEKANRDYQRVMNLYKDSVSTLEQLQNAKTGLDIAKQQLDAAEFNKEYSEIRATKSGFILHRLAAEGQNIEAGKSVFQTNGAGAGNWLLRVGVSDKEWANISVGDKAELTAETMNGKSFPGAVIHKSEGADPQTGSFTIDIQLTGEKPGAIGAGMFGSAIISTRRPGSSTGAAKQWAIPYGALLDGDGSSGYVFITNDNKTATKIKIGIASIEKDSVIINEGLDDAQAIITSGSAYLNDKSEIKIIP